jgi:predicted RNA-binding Zn-ribbon protein involved in translation (DUF1610 family)
MITCDKCGSEQIQRVSVVYEQGLSPNGKPKTQLAKAFTPPLCEVATILRCCLWFIGVGLLSAFFFILNPGAGVGTLIFGIGFVCFAINTWRYKAIRFNQELKEGYPLSHFPKFQHVFVEKYRKWQNTWYCHKCGNQFVQESVPTTNPVT